MLGVEVADELFQRNSLRKRKVKMLINIDAQTPALRGEFFNQVRFKRVLVFFV